MPKLEVFFDYVCPYCLQGHEYLVELLPQFPDIAIEWRPCEAHPRPEQYGRHSDLCARGMFFALEHGADVEKYHQRMYNAALTDRADIEDIRVIMDIADGLLDSNELYRVLSSNQYENMLSENNRLAWDTYGFSAVPSYRMREETLKSKLSAGVSKEQLAAFLNRHSG
ncbi:MAG: DsbA family protein [Oscillospiraceae bacterium]|nr:DsbA family protein [Oscillospiraceae bacterium]